MQNNKTALIVEGGGSRGVFSFGVIDSFIKASWSSLSMRVMEPLGIPYFIRFFSYFLSFLKSLKTKKPKKSWKEAKTKRENKRNNGFNKKRSSR